MSGRRAGTSVEEGNGARRFAKRIIAPSVPRHLSARFREPEPSRLDGLTSLFETWYAEHHPESVGTPTGQQDLQTHLWTRLERDRRFVVPWLDAARPLDRARVLEIGCGTGSSTVALAEQGARVIAVDIDESAMKVAEERCRTYRVETRFVRSNAVDLPRVLAGEPFDFIIFFATLEHMTYEERLQAMRETWRMLGPGGLWSAVETPNRLWYFDSHTASLPFYMWLPDELAYDYSRFSPRPGLREHFQSHGDDAKLEFLRWGRAVSYHEFELTLGALAELHVVSSLEPFHRSRHPLRRLVWAVSPGGKYEQWLKRVGPRGAHLGFYQPYLDLIIRKQ